MYTYILTIEVILNPTVCIPHNKHKLSRLLHHILSSITLFSNSLHLVSCSQDKQVTWALHGHIQCTRSTHLLGVGELWHAPAMKMF